MTYCPGSPSLEVSILILIISAIIPSIFIYLIHKKWKPKNKSLRILFSVVGFIAIFLLILIPLSEFFTPPCSGPSVRAVNCISFDFYPQNNTCKYGNQTIFNKARCKELREKYISQREAGGKICPEGTIRKFQYGP